MRFRRYLDIENSYRKKFIDIIVAEKLDKGEFVVQEKAHGANLSCWYDGKNLVGDRDPRSHEFSVQLRSMDIDSSGHGLGLSVLIALCGGLIERSVKGGLIIVGALNLGGSVELIPNPVSVAELAVEKGATTLLMPISSRRQLFDLSDDMATKINIEFYSETNDAFLKAIMD